MDSGRSVGFIINYLLGSESDSSNLMIYASMVSYQISTQTFKSQTSKSRKNNEESNHPPPHHCKL